MSRTVQRRQPPPGPAGTEALYETDLYAWSVEQARLLKERRYDQLDAENVAEEVLDVGRTEYRALESALRVLLIHFLKWDHQPARRSQSWANTIAEQRRRVARRLTDSPSLKARLDEAIEAAYGDARLRASSQTGLYPDAFPETCPYSWDEIMDRPFEPVG